MKKIAFFSLEEHTSENEFPGNFSVMRMFYAQNVISRSHKSAVCFNNFSRDRISNLALVFAG